jgi:tRNA G18 (ribose-2'-O)-methylase SpoU
LREPFDVPRIAIEDLSDPRLEPYRALKRTNATRWRRSFVVEGDKLVARLLASRYPVESVLADEHCLAQFALQIAEATPVYLLPHRLIEQLIGFNFHRGLLACAGRLPPTDLAALCSPLGSLRGASAGSPLGASEAPTPLLARPRDRLLTLVMAAGIQDPENLGSLLRSSAAFRAAGLILAGDCADPFSRRVLRVSMGAALSVPLAQAPDPAVAIRTLQEAHDVECWATVLDEDAATLEQLTRPARLALLFGNEGQGLDPAWPPLCRRKVTIAMPRGVDSLNVGVAAGIFLYHVSRLERPPR